jgi:hypothetical protein
MFAMAKTYNWFSDEHDYGRIKKLFIDAHANHVGFKLKRNTTERRDTADLNE